MLSRHVARLARAASRSGVASARSRAGAALRRHRVRQSGSAVFRSRPPDGTRHDFQSRAGDDRRARDRGHLPSSPPPTITPAIAAATAWSSRFPGSISTASWPSVPRPPPKPRTPEPSSSATACASASSPTPSINRTAIIRMSTDRIATMDVPTMQADVARLLTPCRRGHRLHARRHRISPAPESAADRVRPRRDRRRRARGGRPSSARHPAVGVSWPTA